MYFVGLVLGALLAAALLATGSPSAIPTGEFSIALASALVFFPFILGGPIAPLNVPAWSLIYELAANVLYAWWMRLGGRGLYLILALSFLGFSFFSFIDGSANIGVDFHQMPAGILRTIFSFSAGIAVHRLRGEGYNHSPWVYLLFVAALLLAPVGADWRAIYDLVCIGFLFPLSIWALSKCSNEIAPNFMGLLGTLSFPMYAIHWPMIWLVNGFANRISPDAPPVFIGVVFLLILIATSYLLEQYMDRPLRERWRSKVAPAR